MAGYISESFRHYTIAKQIRESIDEPSVISYAVIAHCAIYLEAVLNDVIFAWKMNDDNDFPNFSLSDNLKEIDLYNEQTSIYLKLNGILFPNSDDKSCQDSEFIEFKHLISIRNSLFHLKPTVQLENGKSGYGGPKKALRYLINKNIIKSDPYGVGVFWADTIDHNVSDWALNVAGNVILYLYKKTFFKPFGIHQLSWQCQLLGRKC